MINKSKLSAVKNLIVLKKKISKLANHFSNYNGFVMYQPQCVTSSESNFFMSDYTPLSCFLSSPYYLRQSYNSSWHLNSILNINQAMAKLPNHSQEDAYTSQSSPKSPSLTENVSYSALTNDRPTSDCSADGGIYACYRSCSPTAGAQLKLQEKAKRRYVKLTEQPVHGSLKGNKSSSKNKSGAGNKRQHNIVSQNSNDDNAYQHQPPQKKPLLHNSANRSQSKTQSRQWDFLSSEIWQKYLDQKQDDNLYCKKMKLWNFLFNLQKETFPYCGLYVVGSSMTGLGSSSSDVDMCLMLSHEEINQKTDAMKILKFVARIIKSKYIQNPVLIRAKVPILNFYDSQSGCNVDLNINNAVGIRNTQLLKCYADCDWRVRPLVLIIKSWAQMQGINDAKSNTLSSYSLVLMIIHFLQCGVEPSVLPCLQKHFPNKFLPDSDVRTLSLNEHLPIIPSRNKMSLGELLVNFFDYYANTYDYDRNTMSVRLGCVVPTYLARHQPSLKNTPAQWNLVCIEEPFDYSNTARSVYDNKAFKKIVQAFQTSCQLLKKNKSLNSILRYS